MKFRARLQWNWLQSALLGVGIGLLLAPIASNSLDGMKQVHFGNKYKVMINGDVVALSKSVEEGEQAFKAARLAYNANGIRSLKLSVSYEEADAKQDKEAISGLKVLQGEELEQQILEQLSAYESDTKQIAYTMRIDDYTVTSDNMESLISALEKTQGKYDEENQFQVKLKKTDSQNVAMYEVEIAQNEEASDKKDEDGIKYVGFEEDIQVVPTYASKDQIKKGEDVYAELSQTHEEPGIYVVKPGDCLGVIAEKNNMTEEQLKELNPDVQSDENLYYDDRLHIVVPMTAVQVLVKKQVTYEESYYADTIYEDDDDMFIGESKVVQEGSEGTHVVTDLVTYTNDMESDREQLEENVEVAAVAEIVRRGTKSKPTYMYPVTNWNVTSNFGYRWGRLHAGTDVGVPIGTTVRASRAGKVVTAGWVGGYGNCVMIDHGDGIWTVYGHLSEITTSVGSYVEQGQQIALSGNTGRSTGPHLHFEVRVNGSATDATPYLEGTVN
ncbi:MAG: M23 family metallopeptidase [Eubacteriales bacterium]|nr:M23 family metallopeptidase [Eubacteriales bacterium]